MGNRPNENCIFLAKSRYYLRLGMLANIYIRVISYAIRLPLPFALVAMILTTVVAAGVWAIIEDQYTDELGDCDNQSPLVLDLDGDGVEADALAYFDHEGDGWSELSRWANEDDGVLVWDRNNDGVINDGSELFGNNTALGGGGMADHGFRALSELDENGDGVVDAKDSDWANLRVMRWMRPGFWGFGESRLVW